MPNESELFDFIDATHRAIYNNLMRLSSLVSEHEGGAYSVEHQKELLGLVRFFNTEAKQHHIDEERYVFPTLLTQGDANLEELTRKLFEDHEHIEASWEKVGEMLLNVAQGQESSSELRNEFNAFYVANLKHMKLEESIAFPIVSHHDQNLDLQAMKKEMSERRKAQH